MKLDFIDHDKLFIDKTNMRHAKKAPDVSDIIATVRKRGIIVPLIVKPADPEGRCGIVAGSRRWTANGIARAEGIDHGPLACAILEDGDDAAAIEASMIENLARLDPDEVTQWETFVRLVKEGRTVDDIAATFGLPDLAIRRVLALGNLLPRIRDIYRQGKIDGATVRHLTLAAKSQQKAWLALFDDPDSYVPTGHQLKAWLFGGQSIPARFALFDLDRFQGATIADLFGDDRYFTDADGFWEAQNAAIETRREAYLDAGWSSAVIVPPSEHFSTWEYEKAPKRKGGRVYVEVRQTGEVIFHEGYLTRKEARRGEAKTGSATVKPARPELTSTLLTYVDLHRHAAVRAAMTGHPAVALRLMVAHAIVGSPLWGVKPDPQNTRNDEVRESVETCFAETRFDEERRGVLALLDFSSEDTAVTGGNGDGYGVVSVFLRLLDLGDDDVLRIIAVVMGETLSVGSAAVAAVGEHIAVDMADWWHADGALFELIRDKEVLGCLVADVAGQVVAKANAGEKSKTLKRIITDHLDGKNGRTKVERWVPRWMAFPAAAYTARGGVGTVEAHAKVAAARGQGAQPEQEETEVPFAEAA